MNETIVVQYLKWVILPVLLCAAVLMSLGTYIFIRGDKKQDFETQFEADALKVVYSFHEAVERKLGSINTMATSITSFANYANLTSPM
jgi:hypothetical protein